MTGIAVALILVTIWAGRAVPPRLEGKRLKGGVFGAVGRRNKSKSDQRGSTEKPGAPEDLGLIVSEVATRLRSGAGTEAAWVKTFDRFGMIGCLDESGVPLAVRRIWNGGRGVFRRPGTLRTGVPAAIAVCRMSWLTGAPTADILDSCAQGISEAGEAKAARDVALAGPKASARMLAWLPLMGIGFGTIIGARPLVFLTGEWLGNMCLVIGVGLEVAGVMWVRRLTHRAENAA